MLPLGTLSLDLWLIAVDPAFTASHQIIKNLGIWTDQLDHLPAVMTTSFFLIFSEHPWDKLRANLPHLQFLANNCVYSSNTDIKLCTYCLYRHTTVLIHEILYLANQFWCSHLLTPPTPLFIPHRLPAFLESLLPLKNWCSIHVPRPADKPLPRPADKHKHIKLHARRRTISGYDRNWLSPFSF